MEVLSIRFTVSLAVQPSIPQLTMIARLGLTARSLAH